jgi:hypothetical protein
MAEEDRNKAKQWMQENTMMWVMPSSLPRTVHYQTMMLIREGKRASDLFAHHHDQTGTR